MNAATPAFGVLNFLHNNLLSVLPVTLEVDLILVDYAVNDALIENFDYDVENLKRAHEILLRHVRIRMQHAPAVLYVETYRPPSERKTKPLQMTNIAEVHGAVAQKYDIPVVSRQSAHVYAFPK